MRIKIIMAAAAAFAATASVPASATDFTYAGGISIPGSGGVLNAGPASPFPVQFNVAGLGTVTDVNLSFTGLTHTFMEDLFISLLSPNGTNIVLMNNAGGSSNFQNSSITFDQQALGSLPDNTLPGGTNAVLPNGSYKASAYGLLPTGLGLIFDGANLNQFNGGNANGVWSLYIYDQGFGDSGSASTVTLSLNSGAVPEPATWAMMFAGFAGVGIVLRRRKSMGSLGARSVLA